MSASNEFAIVVRSLTKVFPTYRGSADVLMSLISRRWNLSSFTALDGVDLKVGRGESVGIMGRNGAGKSTLLKILAGTLKPTAGSFEVKGRTSAILELGTGFHPDYTGRENIRMGGLCLGMSPSEVEAKTDWIIRFAELEEFIDRPFKTYSSGMQARLTFSVATSVEPEVLIVDEALSAGDALFARKCQRRIREITDSGATVLLVSHSISTIFSICDRAVLLDRGRVIADGDPREISNEYDRLMNLAEARRLDNPTPAYGDGDRPEAEVVSARLVNDSGVPVRQIDYGRDCAVEVVVRCWEKGGDYIVGMTLQSDQGPKVYSTNTKLLDVAVPMNAGDQCKVRFPFRCLLGGGRFYVSAGVKARFSVDREHLLHKLTEEAYFDVTADHVPFSGVVDVGVIGVDVTSTRVGLATPT